MLLIKASLITVAALCLTSGSASATSLRVKLACASDYYAYCSAHSPESAGVRSCMRANGLRLSNRCVNALVAAGEVSAGEVASRRSSARVASSR